MSRAAWWAGTLVALGAAGGGYWIGKGGELLPGLDLSRIELPMLVATVRSHLGIGASPSAGASEAQPSEAPSGQAVYYRDPDGRPFYSLGPKRTADGREFLPVRASEDVGFEERLAATVSPAPPGERRILYYRNPMGLPDTSKVPKKDSMGMDYIPVYEGETDGATVTISPVKLQRTGVRSEPVQRRVLSLPVRAPGIVEEDERRIAVVTVRSEAFVEKVEDVTTGDHVRKGQPLLRLYSPEISAAAAQYLSSLGVEGARRRLENLAVPPEVIAEIERTRKLPRSVTWAAPRDGVVFERNVIDGMRAMPGEALFRIADHSVVWVLADVTERDLAHISEGQQATVEVRGALGRKFTGTVASIYPHLTMQTRTARVRIELPNPDGVLRPAMYADVEIATGSPSPVVSVPDSALIDTGTRQVVLLAKGEGRFEPREVKAGIRGAGFTEIREGLAEGDRVVVTANFLIDAESNLRAALQAMASPEASP
jgi:Cu(I)/Ag(I) efflux system membrane fusion protein